MLAELFGAITIAYIGAIYHPFTTVDQVNSEFAARVDAVESCWYRVSGEPGAYGSPEDYSLDLLCRYRVVDGVVTRS
jgi:hypothetical protein